LAPRQRERKRKGRHAWQEREEAGRYASTPGERERKGRRGLGRWWWWRHAAGRVGA